MPNTQVAGLIDHAYRIVHEDVEKAHQKGLEAATLLAGVVTEPRLNAGLILGLAEAQKHFNEGSAIVSRMMQAHLRDIPPRSTNLRWVPKQATP